MENCVAPGLDAFDVLLEVVLSLVRVSLLIKVTWLKRELKCACYKLIFNYQPQL